MASKEEELIERIQNASYHAGLIDGLSIAVNNNWLTAEGMQAVLVWIQNKKFENLTLDATNIQLSKNPDSQLSSL